LIRVGGLSGCRCRRRGVDGFGGGGGGRKRNRGTLQVVRGRSVDAVLGGQG